MMSDTLHRQSPLCIDYMPWAGIREEFTIGPVAFWPFYGKAEEKIADKDIREYLMRFFECFVDMEGNPVKSIVICTNGNVDFRPLPEDEAQTIRAAVDCLIFTQIARGTRNGVCANYRTMAPPTSDCFTLYTRNFRPDQEDMAVRIGSTTNYFSDMASFKISQPLSLGGSFGQYDQRLLTGFAKVFENSFPSDVRERLFRALEWFRLVHTESDAITWQTKLVMVATAFEILLQFPRNGKSKHFVDYMENVIRSEDFKTDPRNIRNRTLNLSLAGCWAFDFYDLRSKIVHGDRISPDNLGYKEWVTHLIVADLVLLECIQRLLYEHRCIGEDIRRRIAECASSSSESTEDIEKAMLPGMLGLNFESVHTALGWISPSEERP